METRQLSALKKTLETPQKVVIVPHKNPDGDAIGSSLALAHFLESHDHETTVIVPNDYPSFLKWLPGTESIRIYEKELESCEHIINNATLFFALDYNALHRTGDMETVLAECNAEKVLIDHHRLPEDFAEYVYSDDTMSSTCEMIYHFLDMLGAEAAITPAIATCIYVGIMTDTGSFRFPSTTSTTHRVVANLIDKGAVSAEIHNQVYDTNSINKLHLLGRALNNLVVLEEFNTAYITLTQADLDEFDFKKGDTEGVVNYALSVDGIKLAVIFIENKAESIIKMSLRSKGTFDVNLMARNHFNGGGHINAAGGRSHFSLKNTVDNFISILATYKDDLKS